MSKVSQLAGFPSTQNRCFLFVEGSMAWLYDSPHHLSPQFIPGKSHTGVPVNNLDTVMYVDPITRQTFEYASQIPFENNPQNDIALGTDTTQNYVLSPETKKNDPP